MKGKIYFAAGAVVGLLTGSRLGRGLYDRAAKSAGAVAGNETLRQGVASAGEKAVDAAKSAGGGVSHKVSEIRQHVADKHAGEDEDEREQAEEGDGVVGSGVTADGGAAAVGRLHRFHRTTTGAVNGTIASASSPGSTGSTGRFGSPGSPIG
jgi:hypothetical protein